MRRCLYLTIVPPSTGWTMYSFMNLISQSSFRGQPQTSLWELQCPIVESISNIEW